MTSPQVDFYQLKDCIPPELRLVRFFYHSISFINQTPELLLLFKEKDLSWTWEPITLPTTSKKHPLYNHV